MMYLKFSVKFGFWIFAIVFLSACGSSSKVSRIEHIKPASSNDIRPIIGKQALATALDTILQDSTLSSTTTGLKVVRVSDGEVLFQQNSDKLFHPASNMKLFTAAAALLHLGPEYRFKTTVAMDSAVALSDTLFSNIYLIGTGDPSFDTGDLAEVVEILYGKGIRYIAGDIVCDDTWLDDNRYGEGWMWDDQPSTNASPIGALTINGNNIELFVQPGDSGAPAKIRLMPKTRYVQILNESISIDSAAYKKMLSDTLQVFEPFSVLRRWREQNNIFDAKGYSVNGAGERRISMNIVEPSLYFGTLFEEACERIGIKISGQIVRDFAPGNTVPLADHQSDPVVTLVTNMNKPSDNLYAELLLKAVGAHVKGKPGTSDKGKEVIHEMLAGLGIDVRKIRISDGSGVSRYGLLSPDVIVALLINMYNNFSVSNEFIASLPIGGVDGTLENRMHGLAAERIVHAKTGSLGGVSTLSGYTASQDGEVLAFSIMMSHYVGSARPFREVQDRICDVLTRYRKL